MKDQAMRDKRRKLPLSKHAVIRRLRARGWTQVAIARRYGISQTWVSMILRAEA